MHQPVTLLSMPVFKRRGHGPSAEGPTGTEPREVFRHLDWPFPDGRFPPSLGAVIQQTVMAGELPACEVIHTDENSWIVGDGVNDPNLQGACVVGHFSHVIESNSSIAGLADLPLGWRAVRDGPGVPWRREPVVWLGDEEPFEPLG